MHVESETERSPEDEANKVLQIVLTYAIVNPWTVVVELGHAMVALAAVFRAQRLSYYASRAELLEREFVLLDELENCLVHLVAVGRNDARIGFPGLVEIVPGQVGHHQESDGVEREQIEDERPKVDEPSGVQPEYERHCGCYGNVFADVTIEEEHFKRVRDQIDQAERDGLVDPQNVRLKQNAQVEQDKEWKKFGEHFAYILKK